MSIAQHRGLIGDRDRDGVAESVERAGRCVDYEDLEAPRPRIVSAGVGAGDVSNMRRGVPRARPLPFVREGLLVRAGLDRERGVYRTVLAEVDQDIGRDDLDVWVGLRDWARARNEVVADSGEVSSASGRG